MNLRSSLFASLAIAALAVPATSTVVLTLSAGPVMAKGGNGQGGSNRGDRGNRGGSDRGKGGSGGSKGASAGQGGAKGGNSGNAGGNGGGNYGQSGKGTQAAPVTASAMATEIETDIGETEAVTLHPSTLGSMNGAMNANINAVLAHIGNGNTNGPVGALAALAVADHDAAGAQQVIDTAELFGTLETELEKAGYADYDAYLEAVGAEEIEPIQLIDDAHEALGDLAGTKPPSEDDVAKAGDALAALGTAEAGILDAWNKSGTATDAEKAALLDALREKLSGDSALIAEAIAAADPTDGTGDGTGDDAGDGAGDDGGDDTGDMDAPGDEPETDGETGETGSGTGTGDEGPTDGGDTPEDGDEEGDGSEGEGALDPETQAMLDGLEF